MPGEQRKLKIRLVIPICDRVYYDYYCFDAKFPEERLNLLKKAFSTPFGYGNNGNNNIYPNLIITSNNFLFISVDKEYCLDACLEGLFKNLDINRPSIHLLIGVDSYVENPYEGISASVYYFAFENGKVSNRKIWECWEECKEECFKNQNQDRRIKNLDVVFYSCGDILKSCHEGQIYDSSEGKIIVDLAHMNFTRNKLTRGRNKDEDNLKKLTENHYLIVTTQIRRNTYLKTSDGELSKYFFGSNNNDYYYKLVYKPKKDRSEPENLKEQKVVALDKQGITWETIDDFSFKDKKKLNQVDAFFIDFEIPIEEENPSNEGDNQGN